MTSRSEFERINEPRVEKIIDMVRVITKSAKSNGVEAAEVGALVQPALDALGQWGEAAPVEKTVETDAEPVKPARLVNGLHHLQADELVASIPDGMLTNVLTRIINRMSEAWETKK